MDMKAAVREQVDRILASPGFQGAGTQGPALRALIDGALAGRNVGLSSEVPELRAKLIDYYAGAGKSDPVVIELGEDGSVEMRVTQRATAAAPGYQPTPTRKLVMFLLCLISLIAVWVFYFLAKKQN